MEFVHSSLSLAQKYPKRQNKQRIFNKVSCLFLPNGKKVIIQ
jgi:hypothetical protein